MESATPAAAAQADNNQVDDFTVASLPWPRPDGSAGEIAIRRYAGDKELPAIMALMAAELSEPYSIFTFRHFLDGWPKLCFVVRTRSSTMTHHRT